jgi:hypothetical protein
VFSTFLYSGTGASQTITNNIDLSTKGGLLWLKARDDTRNNWLYDTVRGKEYGLRSDLDFVQNYSTNSITAFNNNGFSIGDSGNINSSGNTLVSWSFRKQPKFFDVVTFTGTQNSSGTGQVVSHNLGSTPGCIIIKVLSDTSGTGFTGLNNWIVYHRGLSSPTTQYLRLNLTNSIDGNGDKVKAVSDTTFTAGWEIGLNGFQYVAYLFAHDAGGFGLTGTDNVVSCGSYTGNGTSSNFVTLGYEPQWIMIKKSSDAESWYIYDSMRGVATLGGGQSDIKLRANSSGVEGSLAGDAIAFNATGFNLETSDNELNNSGSTYIYIAIRRGPMKVPTVGTSVLGLNARSGTGANATVTGGAGVSDAVIVKNRGSAVASLFSSRLTGTRYLVTSTDAAEVAAGTTILQANPWDVMDGVKVGTTSTITNASSNTFINYLFKRAPSVFDVCCYTGNGSTQNVSHNLGVAPELIIAKSRSLSGSDWWVYASPLTTPQNKYLRLQSTDGESTATGLWGSSLPTSTTFGLGAFAPNSSGETFVAYLFATLAGVSKVGSYVGTHDTTGPQTINCGFTSGARFVLIKQNGSSYGWWVFDTARGINPPLTGDPYFELNSNSAESTLDMINPDSSGFIAWREATNIQGVTYIFLAIA